MWKGRKGILEYFYKDFCSTNFDFDTLDPSLSTEIRVHCTFRKIGGALLVVGTGLILRRCSTLEEFVEAFRVATLPAANALRAISEGSVCFTVQAENRSALEALWERYRDGALQRDLQEFLVTEEIRQLAEGEEVVVTVYIDEQEFRNALVDLSSVEKKGNSLITITSRKEVYACHFL